MKLPSSSPAVLRQERGERLRRDRAAKLPLREAFPSVEQLRLELQFDGPAANIPAAQSHVLHPPARAFFEFPCPHADCDGQFDLTVPATTMLVQRGADAKGVLKCTGQRPDRRVTRVACDLSLHYFFTAMYRSGE